MIDIESLIQHLHRLARESPGGGFREAALVALREVLPFDTASWGTAFRDVDGFLPRDTYLHEQPDSIVDSYLNVRNDDIISARAFGHLDLPQLFNWPCVMAGRRPPEQFRDHCETYGYLNVLSVMHRAPDNGHYTFLTLTRKHLARPFGEAEQSLVRRVLPHLLDAWVAHFAWHADALEGDAPCGGGVRAICTAGGRILGNRAALAALLDRDFARHDMATLPAAVLKSLSSTQCWEGAAISIRAVPVADVLIVHARAHPVQHALTPRELAVARRASDGLTYKAIARELNLSPGTVRNHLHNAYGKLDVTNKTALAQRIRAQ